MLLRHSTPSVLSDSIRTSSGVLFPEGLQLRCPGCLDDLNGFKMYPFMAIVTLRKSQEHQAVWIPAQLQEPVSDDRPHSASHRDVCVHGEKRVEGQEKGHTRQNPGLSGTPAFNLTALALRDRPSSCSGEELSCVWSLPGKRFPSCEIADKKRECRSKSYISSVQRNRPSPSPSPSLAQPAPDRQLHASSCFRRKCSPVILF
ncbi:hypothetical protein H920_04668 [Fukomys damarensis]|uniref:Uncharacterized protein n=1 Tax=Fukomys damarensis TaxID=885580 RepID=A0A091DTU4_FUKDA|nr:hypothetical protein H920_04668 [Fukomys damarensis]